MSTKKATKRALLTSILAICLCLVMLIGSTFAWFTDTASTNVNQIQSGTLKVDIVAEDGETSLTGTDGKLYWTQQRVKSEGEGTELVPVTETGKPLWEPGVRFLTQGFKIKNNGNLALKWKVDVNKGATSENEKKADLLDVIEFFVVTKKNGVKDKVEALSAFEGTLETQNAVSEETYYIEGHMQETAGNDYQGLTLNDITITVYATQLNYEYDSTTKDYDKDAKYTEVIAAGKAFTGTETISTGITATDPNAIAVKAIGADANVTITYGNFDGGEGGNNICVAAANGATVTIKDGTFTVGGDANGYGNSVIYTQGGKVVIEGGFFYTNCSYNGKYYVLNQNNGDPGTITVKGGTFVNFNPAGGDDYVQPTNFVADGYKVVSETKESGEVWYTVVPE